MNSAFGIFGIVVLVFLVIFIGPWFTILMLNTLFGLGIEVTVGTWFAALWLMLIIGAGKASSSKK